MRLSERELERIFRDKSYWQTVAAEIIAESGQKIRREAGPAPGLGKILESRLLSQRTRYPSLPPAEAASKLRRSRPAPSKSPLSATGRFQPGKPQTVGRNNGARG